MRPKISCYCTFQVFNLGLDQFHSFYYNSTYNDLICYIFIATYYCVSMAVSLLPKKYQFCKYNIVTIMAVYFESKKWIFNGSKGTAGRVVHVHHTHPYGLYHLNPRPHLTGHLAFGTVGSAGRVVLPVNFLHSG
jgi:hypothetical protein